MTTQERRKKMLQLVTDWQQSGQSQKAFADAHDIKLFTFRLSRQAPAISTIKL